MVDVISASLLLCSTLGFEYTVDRVRMTKTGEVTYWKYSKRACKGGVIERQTFNVTAGHNHGPESELSDVTTVRIEVSTCSTIMLLQSNSRYSNNCRHFCSQEAKFNVSLIRCFCGEKPAVKLGVAEVKLDYNQNNVKNVSKFTT